ncbi:MAG: hypothetical protein Q8Q96_00960, partial [bacterium]|nr:hypothetical protein [bacterium]
TVYILQKQQEVRSRAAAATKLYFSQPSQTTPPLTTLQKTAGETFDLDIIVNPGTNQNQVSFIGLNITYDGSKLDAVDSKLRVNETAFPAILKAPSYASGNASVTISVGADPAKVITTVTKVATITFKVMAVTVDPTISIAFTGSQVLSIASSDQPSENVLADSTPLLLTIVPATAVTPTAKPSTTPGPGAQKAPECTSLNTDRTPSGAAPFALALIANGNDSDGTINKVAFNFGDGPAQDVTQGGGIGTKTVNVQIAHEYKNSGTFKASALLTDNSGAVSSSTSCTQTITVTGGVGGGAIAPTATAAAVPSAVAPTATAAAKVTITPPGPGDSIIGIGIAGVVLSILGGLLLLAL